MRGKWEKQEGGFKKKIDPLQQREYLTSAYPNLKDLINNNKKFLFYMIFFSSHRYIILDHNPRNRIRFSIIPQNLMMLRRNTR